MSKPLKGRYSVIVDNIENLNNYECVNKRFKNVIQFIENNDLKNMPAGSYEIDGKDIFVNIDEYETKSVSDSMPESHRNYIDIQIVLCGHEKIGYSNLKNAKTVIEYNDERDIEFYSANSEYFKAEEGRFFIFFPQDVHHPCITDDVKSKIKKAVFKIKI